MSAAISAFCIRPSGCHRKVPTPSREGSALDDEVLEGRLEELGPGQGLIEEEGQGELRASVLRQISAVRSAPSRLG